MHLVVRGYAQQLTVVRRMMDLAQAQAVWNYRISLIGCILNNVGSIKEFRMF